MTLTNEDIQAIALLLQPIKDDLGIVKKDVKHLKRESIKLQAMDEAIFNEIERVHEFLDKHKENKTVKYHKRQCFILG